MPSARRIRRSLAVAALAATLFAGSMLVTESGLANRGTGPPVWHLPAIAARTAVSGWPHDGPELCQVTPRSGHTHQMIVMFGASYTAGVGAPAPGESWAVRLAELLGWHAVALGVPGAGYTSHGDQHLGPLTHEVQRVDLTTLRPAVVVVQAGHDDWNVPPGIEAVHVTDLVRQLKAEAPHARLAFLTVFSLPHASAPVLAREQVVDSAIVAAVHRADPHAVIIDPLREHWHYPRFHGGLHPDADGHLLIAQWVAHALVRAGAVPGAAARPGQASVSCTELGRPGSSQRSTSKLSGSQVKTAA